MNNLSQKPPRLSLPPGGAVVSSNWLVSYLIEGCGGTSSYFGPTHPGPPSRYLTQQSHSTHSASAESGDIDEHWAGAASAHVPESIARPHMQLCCSERWTPHR